MVAPTIGTGDAFDAIYEALAPLLQTQFPVLKYVASAWSDPKWFEDTGSNLPSLFLFQVSESGKPMRSRYQPFAVDANFTYYETSRQQLHIQFTLAASTPDDRTTIGGQIKQYLVNLLSLPLADGQRSLMTFRGDVSPKGSDNLYLRHLTFQFQARILQAIAGTPATTITPRNTINS